MSVKRQIFVKTCQNGSLKFSKYQDVEDKVEEQMQTKELIATTVSSREKGIRRREEGETSSSQRMISIQGNQEESRKAEDELPTHTRNSKNNNDDETKRMEEMRGKGGGRLKHRTVDGGVPLCLRRRNLRDSKDDSSSKRNTHEEKESRSSTQSKTKHCVMNKMASGSEGTCPHSTEEKG